MANRLQIQESNRPNVPVVFINSKGICVHSSFDSAAFQAPWTLADIHAKLNDPGNRRQAQPIGQGLFDRLFVPESELRKAWDRLSPAEQAAPLEIAFADAEFRGYPWEMLQHPTGDIPALLNSFVRRAASNQCPSDGSDWPFRLLVLVGSDDPRIGAMQEVEAVKRSLGAFGRCVDLHIPKRVPGSAAEVHKILAEFRPHMLHFIGHGGTRGGEYVLILEGAPTWYWNIQEIRLGFRRANCVPRAAFLNCCRSGAEMDALMSVQEAFSQLGVPAVVAMQADVRGDKAAKFSREFYSEALAGENPQSVAKAVNGARVKLGSIAEIDWALPTLTLASDANLDYQLRKPKSWPTSDDFRVCSEFVNASIFANCRYERSQMVHWRSPINPNTTSPRLLIIKAPPRSGKSHLLHWSMESWAVEGSRICYIRVDHPKGKNCLDWLLRLRAGDVKEGGPEEQRLLQLGLDRGPFEPFYCALGRLLDIPPGPAQVETIDSRQRAIPDDLELSHLFELYIEGLHRSGDVILVLDQVDLHSIGEDVFALFRKHFLAPIAKQQQNIRVVLVVPEQDYRQFKLDTFAADEARVVSLEIENDIEVLEHLAVEALGYPEDEESAREAARGFLKRKGLSQGMARLVHCQLLIQDQQFPRPVRMR